METSSSMRIGSGGGDIVFYSTSEPSPPSIEISAGSTWLTVDRNIVHVQENTNTTERQASISVTSSTPVDLAYNGIASVTSGYTLTQDAGTHTPTPQNVVLHFNCPITLNNNTGGRYRDMLGVGQSLALGRDFGNITSSFLSSWDGRAYCSEETTTGGVSNRTLSGNVTLRYSDYIGGSIYITFYYIFDICDTSSSVDVEITMDNSNDPWEQLSITNSSTDFHSISLEYQYEIPSDNPTDIYITEPISITVNSA